MNLRSLPAVLSTLLAFALLAGCASGPHPPPQGTDIFFDAAFDPPSVRIDPAQALAFSPAMQRFADTEMASHIRSKGLRDGLIDALYTRGRLQLDYDSEATRTAAEAFDARRGNCLSLVLMTAAFARYYDLPVYFNNIYLEESWTRTSGLFLVAGHVNISLGRPLLMSGHQVFFGDGELLTVDFLPPEQIRNQRGRVVPVSTVVAMYLNNRAAEALTAGAVDDAYWWARAAIETDPRWLASYNTLAVLYRRKGLSERAEAALRVVIEREPLNTQALSNLVLVLGDAGRRAEAGRYAELLAQVQPVPPYRFFDEGIEAMRAGDYATARERFSKEVARAAYVPEFHFWLALASYGLGDLPGARGEIAKALESSTTTKERQLYGAKLAWLNEQRRH